MADHEGPDAPGSSVALARALEDGDEKTFAALVREHHGVLVRLAHLRLGDAEAARAAAGAAWSRFLCDIGAGRPVSPVRRHLVAALLAVLPGGHLAGLRPRAGGGAPSDGFVPAIAELPVDVAQIVLLRDVERLSATDVAAVLHVDVARQQVLLRRGRDALVRRRREREGAPRWSHEGALEADEGTRTLDLLHGKQPL